MNLAILWGGLTLVLLEIFFAFLDHRFSPRQMRARGIDGYSFIEQAAMWADLFILTPLLSCVAEKYQFPWFSTGGLAFFGIAFVIVVGAGYGLSKSGENDASVHDGMITPAGVVHVLFAGLALWMLLMIYFSPLSPTLSHHDLIIISIVMMPFLYCGIAFFSERWRLEARASVILFVEAIAIWSVTAFRLLLL